MWLTLASDDMSLMDLTDYMERYLLDRFATIPGVSQINIFGAGGPSMRVWIDRQALTARNLTVTDIETALTRENVELPAGRLESRDLDFQVRIARNFQTADNFRNLVIAQGEDGHLVRLGEVANVEIASRDTNRIFRTNGALTTGFGIIKASTANTVDVLDAVKREVDEVNAELPQGMELITSGDESLYIRAAIDEIYWTIGITTVLVGFVIFVFLGSLRATLIPLVTIPICLIATFSVLAAFGYSINLVTLLALALSIGLVVDDAIVVLENAHRRIEEHGEAPLLAAFNGTRQVAFAVIATTVVLVSVFAPVAFLRDSIGRVFAELAVTIAAAVIFSAVLALSLSPMMCSKLLRSSVKESRLTHTLDKAFVWLSDRYKNALHMTLRAPWASVAACLAIGFGGYVLLQGIPQEYAPVEDRGQFNGQIQAPEGTSYDRLLLSAMRVEAALQKYFDDGSVQRGIVSVPGWGNNGSGIVNVTLKPFGERKISTQEMLNDLNKQWEEIPDIRVNAFISSGNRGSGGGGGGGSPVQLVLGGPNYDELARWRDIIIARASENPGLVRLDSDLRETQPQVLVRVDQDRAASLGVTARSIGSTLQTLMSERQVTTYVVDGEEYDVVLQARPEQRASYSDLSNIFVRADRTGELVPLSNLMALEDLAGPSQLQRHNRMRAVTLSAQLAPGYMLGEALEYLENIIRTELPGTAQIDYRGESLEYKEASGALYFTFGIALFVVFLVLAAQFESFVHPLVIMVTVPLAVAGGLLGLWVSGRTLNIYSQIGIIMLVGIAAKNGVLIVEFINQLRDKGMEFKEAIVEASRIRLRPVIMTAFAAVMGSVPLILAEGPGSASRAALGVVIFSGVTFATFFTLLIVPAVYNLMARRTSSPNAIAYRLDSLRTEPEPSL
jgi:multidrug efflux pump